MHVHTHPHYGEEQQHLAATVAWIRNRLDEPQTDAGADRHATRNLRSMREDREHTLMDVRDSPYFGRVDWRADGFETDETFYVGKTPIPEQRVYSWQDNLASNLYYQLDTKFERGKLLLVRDLDIAKAALHSIHDRLVDAALAHTLQPNEFTDSLLVKLLRESRSGRLQEIVATIQAQQYAIIQSPADRLLVVQGAPGSGKTALALHRVSYLLYHDRVLKQNRLKRLLVLGPNRIFLGYIAGILPALGEQHVPQKTFDEWVLEMLGTPVDYEPQDVALERLLDPGTPVADKVLIYRNAHNKGSLPMGSLLNAYVEYLHNRILEDKGPLSYTYQAAIPRSGTPLRETLPLSYLYDVNTLRAMLDKTDSLPYNARKAAVEETLVGEIAGGMYRSLQEKLQARGTWLDEDVEKQQRTGIEEGVRGAVRAYFAEWRAENVLRAYRRLLRTPALLRQLGMNLFSARDLEFLALDAPTARRPFHYGDLAALLYLKILLDGTDGVAYDHLVVDEAQDLTPLHFQVLQRYSRNNSMTVLGDLAQGIYMHHGVSRWADLLAAPGPQGHQEETIRQSYRTTQQIIEYANALLTRIGVAEDALAKPIARSGPVPTRQGFARRSDLVTAIIEQVRLAQKQGYRASAIVLKTAAKCQALAQALTAREFRDFQLITDRDADYQGQTAVLPTYLTKGLEFDVVILADADSTTYPVDALNARLLYVALTRAAHILHVCWIGTISPLLDETMSNLQPPAFLAEPLEAEPITVADYAARYPDRTADWYIERLATHDQLRLLAQGTIDPILLELLARSFTNSKSAGDEEGEIPPLDPEVQKAVRTKVARLAAGPDGSSLALCQILYSLLRSPLQAAGLAPPNDVTAPLGDQVLALATLRAAIQSGYPVPPGPWLPRAAVLQEVPDNWRVQAATQLDLLRDYGPIEARPQNRQPHLYVAAQWLPGLLDLVLGYPPAEWDPEVWDRIGHLSEPLLGDASEGSTHL